MERFLRSRFVDLGAEFLIGALAAALFVALALRADQSLSPESRLALFESQYAALWSLDGPAFELAPLPNVAAVVPVSQRLP
jgi:hypothetical protein